jgi:2-(3-amino-3-carboxypropyl)histidine synthase
MKTLFIPAKIKTKINKDRIKSLSKKLPKNIAIAYSIQYQDIAFEIKKLLPNNVTKITQVLGCSKLSFPKTTQAIVLIGSGKFHALSLASEIKLPIYILEKNKLSKIPESEIESLKKTKKASYLKFLNADKVGILVSTKPGQENLKKAIDLSKKIKNKKSYLFISNNTDSSEFENFGLESWINTACPRLDMEDSRIINIDGLNLC